MAENPDKRKARQKRYNQSAKGQQRDRRYEENHPERKQRWSKGMTRWHRRSK